MLCSLRQMRQCMKILITGRNSKIAQELVRRIKPSKLTAYTKAELDITNIAHIKAAIIKDRPNIIINCASFNNLQQAEKHPDLANKVNYLGVKNLVNLALDYEIKLIHFSSNYIFAGNQTEPYIETDRAEPLNVFGHSKLKGENEIIQAKELEYLIFRTSFIYDLQADNVIAKIIKAAKEQEEVYYPAAELNTPTSANLAVELVLRSIKNKLQGVFNLSCSGFASQYDFAHEIIKFYKIPALIKPLTIAKQDDILKPKFSVLDNSKIAQELAIKIPDWQVELTKLLTKYDC